MSSNNGDQGFVKTKFSKWKRALEKKDFKRHKSVDAHSEAANRCITACEENHTTGESSDKSWQRN